MNIQNLLSQMMSSSNPLQMAMSLLNPQQKQLANQFQNLPSDKQAEAIAQYCNKNGITKQQLSELLGMFRK